MRIRRRKHETSRDEDGTVTLEGSRRQKPRAVEKRHAADDDAARIAPLFSYGQLVTKLIEVRNRLPFAPAAAAR